MQAIFSMCAIDPRKTKKQLSNDDCRVTHWLHGSHVSYSASTPCISGTMHCLLMVSLKKEKKSCVSNPHVARMCMQPINTDIIMGIKWKNTPLVSVSRWNALVKCERGSTQQSTTLDRVLLLSLYDQIFVVFYVLHCRDASRLTHEPAYGTFSWADPQVGLQKWPIWGLADRSTCILPLVWTQGIYYICLLAEGKKLIHRSGFF